MKLEKIQPDGLSRKPNRTAQQIKRKEQKHDQNSAAKHFLGQSAANKLTQ